MRKNPYGKILKREPKEQRINTVPKFYSKIIEYSRNTINAYSPPPPASSHMNCGFYHKFN